MAKRARPRWSTGAVGALCAVLVFLTALVVFFLARRGAAAAAPCPACDSCCPPSGAKAILACGGRAPEGPYGADLGEIPGIPAPFGGTLYPFVVTFRPSPARTSGVADLHAQVNMTRPVRGEDLREVDFKGVPYTYDPASCAIAFDPASQPMKLLKGVGGGLSDLIYDAQGDRVLVRVRLKHTFDVNFLFIHKKAPVDVDQRVAFAYIGRRKKPPKPPAAPAGSAPPPHPLPATKAECSSRLRLTDARSVQREECERPQKGGAGCEWTHNWVTPNTCTPRAPPQSI